MTILTELQNAEKGSRELSDKVMIYLHGDPPPFHVYNSFFGVTESVDAALAEIPEGIKTQHYIDDLDQYIFTIRCGNRSYGIHKSLPIAICMAICKANSN